VIEDPNERRGEQDMDLKRDKRQNIQKKLDFSSEQTGEACQAGREETDSRQTMHEPESPANTTRLMEDARWCGRVGG
jgi:hypothetical protein